MSPGAVVAAMPLKTSFMSLTLRPVLKDIWHSVWRQNITEGAGRRHHTQGRLYQQSGIAHPCHTSALPQNVPISPCSDQHQVARVRISGDQAIPVVKPAPAGRLNSKTFSRCLNAAAASLTVIWQPNQGDVSARVVEVLLKSQESGLK